jgi:hypothetical protein
MTDQLPRSEPSADALTGVRLDPTNEDQMGALFDDMDKGSLERYTALRPSARNYFLSLAEPILRAEPGGLEALEHLYAVDYERIPPDPATYINHRDYCGHVGDFLFPAWREPFIRACTPGGGVREINITGAMGIGKTTFAMLCMSYKIARVGHLRDPARFYELQPGSKIVFGIYAVTKSLIKDVGFYDLRDKIIDRSPFFRAVLPRDPHGKEAIHWPQKNLEVKIGSNELHVIGTNLFACVADELNYYAQGEKTEMDAKELIGELSNRLESRYVDAGGDIPGIAIYLSQTRTTSDYLEQRIKTAQANNEPGVMNIRGARWEFAPKPYKEIAKVYPPEVLSSYEHVAHTAGGDVPGFRVFRGDEVQDAKLLDKVTEPKASPTGRWKVEPIPGEEAPDDGIVVVPVNHFKAFKTDIYGALRAVVDVPSGAFTPFFPRRDVLEQAFDVELPFPFPSQELPCYVGQGIGLEDIFLHHLVTRIRMGKLEPVRHPTSRRYLHLDLSQGGDRTGMAMVHASAHHRVERAADDDYDGDLEGAAVAPVGTGEIVKDVEVDFYVALTSGPKGEPIDYGKIRMFIDYLRRIGFEFALVSADQYQSFDMRQRLNENGFVTDLQSVDRTSQPYRDFRQALNETRVRWAFPPRVLPLADRVNEATIREAIKRAILFQELSGLEHDVQDDKIDHRAQNPDGSKGSKDVADGVCGAVFRCLVDKAAPGIHPDEVRVLRQEHNKNLNRYLGGLKSWFGGAA